jgi:DNA-binding response OmpR family regulator
MSIASLAEILVVDDDARIGRLLAHFLGGAGYAVRTASSGEEMRRLIMATSPDLVILDLM